MGASPTSSLLLGLDLGTASVGWALFALGEGDSLERLVDCGVRIFEEGTEGDIEAGRDASRAVPRREARSRRRIIERKVMRKLHLQRTLARFGLLPEIPSLRPTERVTAFQALDKELSEDFYARHPGLMLPENGGRRLFPYHLRAMGLAERLEPHEFGRALYHLVQRRGFHSNSRRAPSDKDEGKVKDAIKALYKEMGDRHLGQYLAAIGGNAPAADGESCGERRVRGRWLHRDMLRAEFDALWAAQAAHRAPWATPEARGAVGKCIFWQRPLKSAKELVAFCELEKRARRAPRCTLEAQRFRMLSKLNNLEAVTPHGEVVKPDAAQRAVLVERLESKGDLSFADLRKLLNLPKGSEFNLERGGEKKMEGNRTAAKLRAALGAAWDALSPEDKDALVLLVYATNKPEVLSRVAAKRFALAPEAAAKLPEVRLEEDYAALSRRAMRRILPHLEAGAPYITAREMEYGKPAPPPCKDLLPPVAAALKGLRNPMVSRTLTELRRLVNSLVARHGKPARIRVELARDLKRSRMARQRISKDNRARQGNRDRLYDEILKAYPGLGQRKETVALKALLAEECTWRCPYCGGVFGNDDLFGPHASVDIEHILPYSRSLDNSFLNKTLAHNACNKAKGNRTPYEVWGEAATERYAAILDRVSGFKCDGWTREAKLKRFMVRDMSQEFAEFTARQLSDTRVASRLAVEYLGWLYGAEALQRVKVSSGGVTALVRDVLGLNHVLGRGEKSRADHRHHVVDAVAVACTDQGLIQRIASSAEWAETHAQRIARAPLSPPWSGFLEDVRARVLGVNVSLRPRRGVNGALHDQTFYSLKGGRVTVRKALEKLSATEVGQIVDPLIRSLVQAKLAELGIKEPVKAFSDGANPVCVERLGGTPVRRVRVLVKGTPERIGQGDRARLAMTGGNHHMAVFETVDRKGRPVWVGEVVTRFEAKRRAGRKEPVVRRERPDGGRFLFTLTSGDVVAIMEGSVETLWRVRTVTTDGGRPRIRMTPLQDARPEKEIYIDKNVRRPFVSQMGDGSYRKVTVTPLGEVRRDNT
ncbi:CRISPR-associated endonuclease Cas9 [Fundidesulfovibrio magnetotacticus]|uniref:CRISPR-associated endonuclease Cas9 n=1 Tax=Fundidesulfovibrio magnetotacticus TaxID=2730080 RepID=A0A6V8LS25_9BACT|nr:type II CRISPR RNA-guided endonuclease Cas9 [Fundidesulfovibrio magnetotacticus]GFK95272.1 CRISPR-associated endonuclease Cas9 [Fundidesulfovibrio magnetotacticus]